jgi:cytochrome c-type biogenesis protein CcmF
LIAWRRATPSNLRRTFLVPVLCGLVALVALLPVSGVPQKPLALAMFALGAFVAGTVGQEIVRGVRARRAMSREPIPLALVSLVRRNRRRYGGYLVHLGMAVLFVGVAASSSFQVSRDATLQPGQTVRVDGYDVRYVRATGSVADDPSGTGAFLVLGAVLDVSKDGKHVATLRPGRGYYPSLDLSQGGVGRLIGGEATSEVAMKAGPMRDLWTAVSPDLEALRPIIEEGNKVVPVMRPDLGLVALTAIAQRYERRPPAATFRIISSPMVFWIWAGSLIVIGGGLIALWPAPDAARRRATASLRAKVAQDLGRA